MIDDVLVEPSSNTAPIKRRRGKARPKPTNLGKISNFFTKTVVHKEWKLVGGKEGGDMVEVRKRKAMDVLEQDASCTTPAKSRRIDDGKNVLTGPGIKTMVYLGAKSFSERETTAGQGREDTNWFNLGGLRARRKCALPGEFKTDGQNRINTQ